MSITALVVDTSYLLEQTGAVALGAHRDPAMRRRKTGATR
jgi:hypothetical protein